MSDYKKRCPVCSSNLDSKYYTLDYGLVCEQYDVCEKCGFMYEFTYGNTRLAVNNKEFIYSYMDSKHEVGLIYKRARNEAYKVQKRLRRNGKLSGQVKICI